MRYAERELDEDPARDQAKVKFKYWHNFKAEDPLIFLLFENPDRIKDATYRQHDSQNVENYQRHRLVPLLLYEEANYIVNRQT